MRGIECVLVNALLDKYERSTTYRTGEQSNRRILLKLYNDRGKIDFDFYDIQNHDQRVEVNTAIEELSRRGIISFEWLRGEAGHIVSKIWLHYDQIEAAYKFAQREPKASAVDSITARLRALYSKAINDWLRRYFEDLLAKSEHKRDFGSAVPADESIRNDLWKLLLFIDEHGSLEITERVLSIQLFSDSKRFENTLRSRLVSILNKYFDTENICENDDELLRQVGIMKYPEYFEFSGAVTFCSKQGVTDFSALSHGGSLSVADLLSGTITVAGSVKKIISIENRANYIEYIAKKKAPDELVIYHAGQYSPSKKRFFKAVNVSKPKDCIWYHWGDIDLGGFNMLARLRREINPDVYPYYMGKEELIRLSDYCKDIAESYIDKLRLIMEKPELLDCVSCIQFMIAKKVKLEQEAMLMTR